MFAGKIFVTGYQHQTHLLITTLPVVCTKYQRVPGFSKVKNSKLGKQIQILSSGFMEFVSIVLGVIQTREN